MNKLSTDNYDFTIGYILPAHRSFSNGELDLNIVEKNQDLISDNLNKILFKKLIKKMTNSEKINFQKLIQKNLLSSHMRIIAKK